MQFKPRFTLGQALVICFLFFIVSRASAQMTIFNIPTADTLQKKSLYFEADFLAKPTTYAKGGFQTYGYRVVYGVTHRMEVGANFYYTRDGSGSSGELSVSAKQNIYRSEKHGVAVSAGALSYMPLRSRTGRKHFGLGYITASKTFEGLNGLKVTGGGYSAFRTEKDFGTKNGVLVGVEQPISKKFSFIADWQSGQNRFGYASAGLNYNITNRQFILAGWAFGNSGRGNNALQVYYGYTLP